MKPQTKMLLVIALLVLAVPLVFAGIARAVYVGDGSVQNGTYGDWDITDYGVCVTGIKSDGTMVIDASKKSRPDCLTVTFPNDASLTSAALCTGDSDANGSSHYWANTCVANDGTKISLNGLDRTATNCDQRAKALGKASGTMTSKCTGSWVYAGPAGNGAPGFCYTRVQLTGAGYTSTTCPTATPGYVWDTTHANCDFSYGIVGYVDANVTKKNGTAGPVRGTYVDLSGYTQGQCLANGYSWSTGVTKSGTTTVATTSPSTIAVATGSMAGCLTCHNTVSQYNSYGERWKETYLMTGHKNMLRKVTPGKNWAGPDGAVYTGAAGGQALNFTAGTATGTYGTKILTYIFGDWMAPAPDGLDIVVDMGGGVAKYNGTSAYSCAACHTTGWSNSTAGVCSLSSKTTQATCQSAGGTWYPSTGVQGTTGAEPLASFPSYTSGITGTWDKDGILCSRCHASTFPAVSGTGTHNSATPIDGQNTNNLCFGCHQSLAKTANGTGADTDLNLTGKIPVANNVTAPAYVAKYSGHVIGNQFLNSPHARFTGTITPNTLGKYDLTTNDKSQYNSTFNGMICRSGTGGVGSGSILKTYVDPSTGAAEIIKTSDNCSTAGGQWVASGGSAATAQGSCTTCHDVHQSIVPEVGAAEPLVRECTTCHVDQVATYPVLTAITKFQHSTGPGTPFENQATDPSSPCVICHMPAAATGDPPSHLFRINVDPAYSTFPTSAEFLGNTKKTANTAPDGTYTNAVWTDLDIACGQCHGGGASGSGAKVLPMSKEQLALRAKGMHGITQNAWPTAAMTASPTVTGRTVSFTDNSTDTEDPQSALRITVNWGDWTISRGRVGSTFSHTYLAGGTFTIIHAVTDTEGVTNSEKVSVVIPRK
jgi:hypothetical protein